LDEQNKEEKPLVKEFLSLMEVLRRLRAPDGCPWDREQTPETIKKYILEEAHELTEAVEQGSAQETCEELGDLFFLLLFLADLYEEKGQFTLKDALVKIRQKMIRRHPHIFGDVEVNGAEDVIANWQAIKAKEAEKKGGRKSALGNLPRSLPALQRAFRIGERVSRVGFDWKDASGVLEKIDEEISELKEALYANQEKNVEEELGDLLFSVANLSRKLGMNPEDILKKGLDKFSQRFYALEELIEQSGRKMSELSPEELDTIWEKVKA